MQQDSRRSKVQQMIAKSALDNPESLKRWLSSTGRTYLVFVAQHLIDCLPWPAGVQDLVSLIDRYRAHRELSLPGRPKEGTDVLGQKSVALVQESDALNPEELDRLTHWAAGQLVEEDPGWTFAKGFSVEYLEKQERLRKSVS